MGFKDGNNSMNVKFNVSKKEKRQNLLHVALWTLKETSRGSRPFTFSTKEPSACICLSILSHSGAKKNQPSNLPAVAVYSFVCLIFITASLHISALILNQNKHAL